MSFAINLICTILPRTLLAPFAGYIADRYSKKSDRCNCTRLFRLNCKRLVTLQLANRTVARNYLFSNGAANNIINIYKPYLHGFDYWTC